jgi:glutamyl-tRNA synthetase
MIKVRFAPSPTGYLHVGGARTALFNWLYAKRNNGKFILRIEDTDDARNTDAAKQAIFDGLRWLGITWDEGPEVEGPASPYYQSQRRHLYDQYLAQLSAAGRTYSEENGAIRFRFSRQPITIHDQVCGDVQFAATEEPDMTIRRPDGSYIFHFVNVVDDIEMGVTHVIRGEDHLSNTWKHIDLFNAFERPAPTYAHIPLILNPSGSKMSKRDEGSSVESYQQAGFLASAVVNYLSLLGWTHPQEQEKLQPQDIINHFDPKDIHSANARFDMTKCTWLNAQHLRDLSPEQLLELAKPFLAEFKIDWTKDTHFAQEAIYSVREKISLLSELPAWTHYYFNTSIPYEEEVQVKLKSKPQHLEYLNTLIEVLQAIDTWDLPHFDQGIADAAAQLSVKAGAIMPLLRCALCGQLRGPNVNTIATLLGQPTTLSRLQQAVQFLEIS